MENIDEVLFRKIVDLVYRFIDGDYETPPNWRGGFSGEPCGLATDLGNRNLLYQVIGTASPALARAANEMGGSLEWVYIPRNVVQPAVEWVAWHQGLGAMRWHWEIPVLRAAVRTRRLQYQNGGTFSAKEISSMWGLTRPRANAVAEALNNQ